MPKGLQVPRRQAGQAGALPRLFPRVPGGETAGERFRRRRTGAGAETRVHEDGARSPVAAGRRRQRRLAPAPRRDGASRRPTMGVWIVALVAALVLLFGGGVVAVAVVVLSHFGKPPDNPDAVPTPPANATPPTNPTPPANPGDGAPPNTDKTDPPKPPDKNPPTKPAGTATWETFYKVDKGMSLDDVTALLGAPTTTRNLDPVTYPGADTRLTFEPEPRLKFTVVMFQGKVVKKTRTANIAGDIVAPVH